MYRCSNFELKESMLNVLLRPVLLLLLLLFLAFPSWSLTRVLLPPIACANRMRLNGFRSKGNLYLWSENEEVVGSPHRQWAGLLSRALPVGAGGRSSLQAAAQRAPQAPKPSAQASSLHTAHCRRHLEFRTWAALLHAVLSWGVSSCSHLTLGTLASGSEDKASAWGTQWAWAHETRLNTKEKKKY